jgi:hypothetical protein
MNKYFKLLNEKIENRFTVPKEEPISSSDLTFDEVYKDNPVKESTDMFKPVEMDIEQVKKKFLELFTKALSGSSKLIDNIIYQVENEFYSWNDNFIGKGIYAIYEYIPGDKIIEYKVKEDAIEHLHYIGKKPLSYFTDGVSDTHESFSDIISAMNMRGENWFWNGFSSDEESEEFSELLSIMEPKSSLTEEESLFKIKDDDITSGSKKVFSGSKWEIWQPESEDAMILLSMGTKWLGGSWWDRQGRDYDEINTESWNLKNWTEAYVIIDKNKLEKKFLFKRGWGGMYSPSGARYSMATWVIKQNDKSMSQWFANQNFQYVSKRIKADLSSKKVEQSGGIYNYPGDGEIPWNKRSEIKKIIIEPETTRIKSRAFSGFISVKEVNLPDNITSIGDYAFGVMDSLESIKFPSKLRKIADNAFYECLSLKQVIIPNGVTEIGRSAFGSCQNLETLFIPNSVTKVDQIVASWQRQQPKLLTIYCEAKERPAGWDERFNTLVYSRTWDDDAKKVIEEESSAPVVWGASKPTITEDTNNLFSYKEPETETLFEDERWKAIRPLNIDALLDITKDNDLISKIKLDDIKNLPLDDNNPLLNNEFFYEFKKNAFFFYDKQTKDIFMYLPKENGWNLLYRAMRDEGNKIGRYIDMKDFAFDLSITDKFKEWLINSFPHVKGQGEFKTPNSDISESLFKEITEFTYESNQVAPSGGEREYIKKVIIDKSVKVIRSNAFSLMSNLEEVVFHDGITHIDDMAFAHCFSLKIEKLPPNLLRIGNEAFRGCDSITELTIPASVSYVGPSVFISMRNLKTLKIEDTNKVSNWYRWYEGINDNVKIIDVKNNKVLNTEDIKMGFNTITSTPIKEEQENVSMFSERSEIKTLYKDENWKVVQPLTWAAKIELGEGTDWFEGEQNQDLDWENIFFSEKANYYFIINIKNPNIKYLYSPKTLGSHNFLSHKIKRGMGIEPFLTSEKWSFSLLHWLSKKFESLEADIYLFIDANEQVRVLDGTYVYSDNPGSALSRRVEKMITKIIIPEGVTNIRDYAFEGFETVKEIKIPSSVKTIGEHAFRRCQSLESIEIPEGVTQIKDNTFWGCSSLKNVKLPNSLLSIGEQAFWGCDDLETIELPQGLTTIESSAFLGCHNLSNVFIPISVTILGSQALQVRNSYWNKTPALIMCEAPEKPSGWHDEWTDLENVEVKWGVKK